MKKVIVSGIRPTGKMHLGHYFGTFKEWLHFQERYNCFFGIMDLHAFTSAYKQSNKILEFSYDILADWLAWGLDPKKVVIFRQSDIKEHLELFILFAMLSSMGSLNRVTTWKTNNNKNDSDTNTLGRFLYPILQAADIAIYGGELVPIGKDQVAHIELAREVIRKFNKTYSTNLTEPQHILTKTSALNGFDGRKMSKSYNNTIPLSLSDTESKSYIKKMLTDPNRVRRDDKGDPNKCTVFTYHKLFSNESIVEWASKGCRSANIGCSDCKLGLSESMNSRMKKAFLKKQELLKNKDKLNQVITEGNKKARAVASEYIKNIKQKVNLNAC